MQELKTCPIKVAMKHLGKKWTFEILIDLYLGKKRFGEFLKANPPLSRKVLAERLKELEQLGIIEKQESFTDPTLREYHLTYKGMALN